MTVITSVLMLGRKNIGVKQREFDPAFNVVLGDIPSIQKANPRYVDVAFLGAHDANTGIAEHGATVEIAASKPLKRFEPLIRNYVYRYVRTQMATVYDQLRYGCRFLHIKVALHGDEWFTSHSILTGSLKTHITDVLRFLSEHENDGEIVSLLFQPIYMGDRSFADFYEDLAQIKYNGKNIFDYVRYKPVDEFRNSNGVRIGDLRYNDITGPNKETGVVLFMRRDQHCLPSWDAKKGAHPYFFDMDTNSIHVWHDHSDVKALDKDIGETVKKISSTDRYDDVLRLNQTQPSSTFRSLRDALYSIYSLSLVHTAKKHNIKLLERPDFPQMLKAMPVFQVDFVTSSYGDFNRRANLALRDYNENLVKNLL